MQTWAQVLKGGLRATQKFRIYKALGADTKPSSDVQEKLRPREEKGLI